MIELAIFRTLAVMAGIAWIIVALALAISGSKGWDSPFGRLLSRWFPLGTICWPLTLMVAAVIVLRDAGKGER